MPQRKGDFCKDNEKLTLAEYELNKARISYANFNQQSNMSIQKTTLLTAATLLVALNANAQEQSNVPANNPAPAKAEEGLTLIVSEKSKITVSGYAQAQYYFADAKNNSGDAYSGFAIRRAAISAKGNISDEWSAEVGFEIDSGSGNKLDGAFVDKAIIAYKSELGKLTAGYQKPAFLMEEYSSSKTQLCIEQSVATRYFAKTKSGISQLSGRHGGIWWDGKVSDLKYTFAVANQYKEDFNSDNNDGVAFYGTLAYTLKNESGLDTEFGINGVFNPGNDTRDETGAFTATKAPHGNVFGIEPYAKIKFEGFTGILNGIYADGDEDAGIKDSVWGVNATVAYRFENNFEPVVRLSYVDVGDNRDLGPGMLQNTPKGTSDHDSAFGTYVGANFYANKHIKISAGYEYTKFDGGVKSENANALRVQLQATF